mmetsp:Transcript_39021/g.34700  ORF Transcript_39021/g.34700 Transcript_39021/m.34700 type:complete len:83 (-) Transcript_39021:1726-1974(-)
MTEEKKEPINLADIEDLYGDLEMGKMMIANFANSQYTPDAFMNLFNGIQKEDWETLARDAHSLKGACRYSAAPLLQDAGHDL